MATTIFKRLTRSTAAPAMVLRGGIVAVNFAVMLGLAALLGLEVFGRLVVIWGLAFVVSSIVAAGAPLLLLRALSDGGRLRGSALLQHVLVYPLLITVAGLILLPVVMGTMPWPAIFGAAFAIHLVTCLASIMRALGSVQGSMALRDAGPQLALGAGAMIASDSGAILWAGAVFLLMISAVAGAWCRRHVRWTRIIHPRGHRAHLPMGLWGTSVLGMALAQVDIIVGGAVLSDGQIGLYAMLRRITNLIALPVTVATWVTSVPVAAAHGAGDQAGLARASANGSRIALIPGVVLLVGALVFLTLMQIPALRMWDADGDLVFVILLTGAAIQIGFAATFTVATLCGLAHFAACARLGSVLAYLGLVAIMPTLGPVSNAIAYVLALSLGSVGLWAGVLHRLGVETSAISLIRTPSWRLS